MSSNNNSSNQNQTNNQSSQGSKSPSQESEKPNTNSAETAGNQQNNQGSNVGVPNDADAKNKQGGIGQTEKAGQDTPADTVEDSEESENTGAAQASKGAGTR